MVNELWFKIGHTHSNIDPTIAVWRMRQDKYRVLLEIRCSVSDNRGERTKENYVERRANFKLKIKRSAKSEFKFSFWSHVSTLF